MIITATRYHDFSYGHRVHGHESKCALLHGHNGRAHFTVGGELDKVGRVWDFSQIKTALCIWLEENWDHRFLAWDKDDVIRSRSGIIDHIALGIVWVPFNPTAENMAQYLLLEVGPRVLPRGLTLVRVQMDETRKCSAAAELTEN